MTQHDAQSDTFDWSRLVVPSDVVVAHAPIMHAFAPPVKIEDHSFYLTEMAFSANISDCCLRANDSLT
jgi:hypothetical protein